MPSFILASFNPYRIFLDLLLRKKINRPPETFLFTSVTFLHPTNNDTFLPKSFSITPFSPKIPIYPQQSWEQKKTKKNFNFSWDHFCRILQSAVRKRERERKKRRRAHLISVTRASLFNFSFVNPKVTMTRLNQESFKREGRVQMPFIWKCSFNFFL